MVSSGALSLREILTGNRFCYGAEIVTTRGFSPPGTSSQLVELGSKLLADPRIGWVSITDNPGGAPMLPPDWLARQLAADRPRIVVHLTCKDMNRNGVEAAGLAVRGGRVREHILATDGRLPHDGFRRHRGSGVRSRRRRVDLALAVDERGTPRAGPARGHRNAAEDQFLHRLRRLAIQAAREGTRAAVFQAAPQGPAGGPVGRPAVGLRHAEVPRGEAVSRLARRSTCR